MAESNLPDLDYDYVDRCIKSLEKLKQTIPPESPDENVISTAIIICESYKNQLPQYQPPIETKPMPPRKNKKENSNNS
jgi:hypothetical protein